jgi:hypothetical protein
MSDDKIEFNSRASALEQRAQSLEQRTSALEYTKAAKTDVDAVEKRAGSLESKFGIAIAVAVVLGLGGAGIGGLLLQAQNKIVDLTDATGKLQKQVDGIGPQVSKAEEQAISHVGDAEKKAEEQIKVNSDAIVTTVTKDLMGRLKVSTHQFCTGEYDGPCPPLPRYDPRGLDINGLAQKMCGASAKFTLEKYREQSGNCCGYAWYNVTCVRFD